MRDVQTATARLGGQKNATDLRQAIKQEQEIREWERAFPW
jgi:hypothetical protein